MRYFSAFTGVGGFDMGMPSDWECVGMSEIDKNAIKILRYRYKDVKNYGDIEKINYEELPDFELLIGGSPCQDLSIAGKRAGLIGVRSRLFFSYISILKIKKPHYFIFENVKGLLSSNGGRDFARVLTEFSESGYDIWWQVADAQWFGIPQHRERVFILGTLGGTGFRKVFFKRGNGEKNPELQGQSANTITKRYRGSQAGGSYIVEGKHISHIENVQFHRQHQNRIYGTSGIAPTLQRKTGGGQVPKIALPVADVTHPVGRQTGRRIKTPDEPSFTLQRMQRQGVAVPVLVGENNDHVGARMMKSHNESAYTIMSQHPRGVYDGMKIRALTPVECEKLQGWESGWTEYGIDEKGNTVRMSDNQRYNLIGNGVVPQIVRNIVEHIMDGEQNAHSY